jgi:hypothetical protein
MIDKMSHKNFAKLLLALPTDEFASLVNGRVTQEQLRGYINASA